MRNFKFRNPVEIIFGKGTIPELAHEIPANKRIMVLYGGGSIKKNGVYDQVVNALASRIWVEFSGIEANPHYETCRKAVEAIWENRVDFLLAVGGGSVIDAVKFIAAAACYDGDPWDFMEGKSKIRQALPFGTVLTLPATGSEMNKGFVITKAETQEKLAANSPFSYPKFSILDPETTYTLPERQTANGIIDTFVHVTEQYLTFNNHALPQDYFAEAILKVLVEEGSRVLQHPHDYDIRANLMWASTWGLNDWIGQGVVTDWATHMIGHELTAFFGIDHGQSLAIVLPGVMHVLREQKEEKILQMGAHIFHVEKGSPGERVSQTIAAVENFFQSLGVKTRLSDYGVDSAGIQQIVGRFKERGWKLGERENITYAEIARILDERR